MKRSLSAIALAVAVVGAAGFVPGTAAGAAPATAHTFRNCTDMHKTYPHGVGRVRAHDKTSGKPVTNFKRSNALYVANKKSDRDGDYIACEKR